MSFPFDYFFNLYGVNKFYVRWIRCIRLLKLIRIKEYMREIMSNPEK